MLNDGRPKNDGDGDVESFLVIWSFVDTGGRTNILPVRLSAGRTQNMQGIEGPIETQTMVSTI